jgi:hypothetical protein
MIKRLAFAAALLAVSSSPSWAQEAAPPPPTDAPSDSPADPTQPDGPPGGGRHMQVFISPAGEPFRVLRTAPYPVADWFRRADADHDGALTRDEFVADSMAFFARLDTDHDGVVDGFEVNDYENKVAPEILTRMMRGDERPGEGYGGGGRRRSKGKPLFGKGAPEAYGAQRSGAGLYGLINEVEPVSGQDRDFNRRIDKDEATFAARDRFAILDEDKDGRLTLETLPKTPIQATLEAMNAAEASGKERRGKRP